MAAADEPDLTIAAPAKARRSGALVVLEGLPGFGKTSILIDWARRWGDDCLALPELNLVGPHAPAARAGASHWCPFATLWRSRLRALAAWRWRKPMIVLDRSYLSTLAVCHALDRTGRDGAYREALAAFAKHGLDCDLLLLFDGPPELGLSRRRKGQRVPFPWDDAAFLNALREFYVEVLPAIHKGRTRRVDGELSYRAVADVATAELAQVTMLGAAPARAAAPAQTALLTATGLRRRLGQPYGGAFEVLGAPTLYFRQHALRLDGCKARWFTDNFVRACGIQVAGAGR